MSCGHDHQTGNCVCNVLKEIARVQADVVSPNCDTSCDQSITDLLGETDNRGSLDTVPLILYCQDGCQPFKGYGAKKKEIGNVQASYYFRVEKVMDDCCAVVELLRDPTDTAGSSDGKGRKNPQNPIDPIDQKTNNLKSTGICITVDLKCFCHVTCLPAISAY